MVWVWGVVEDEWVVVGVIVIGECVVGFVSDDVNMGGCVVGGVDGVLDEDGCVEDLCMDGCVVGVVDSVLDVDGCVEDLCCVVGGKDNVLVLGGCGVGGVRGRVVVVGIKK